MAVFSRALRARFPATALAKWFAIALVAPLLASPLSGCNDEIGLPAYTGTGVRYPTALVADPSGRYVYVVGANFDRGNRGGIVSVRDTVAGGWADGGRVEVPTYASGITLQADALGAGKHRLFVPSREDDSISVIDVTPVAGAAPVLGCGAPANDIGPCGDAWRIGGLEKGDLNVGQDPVSVTLAPGHDGQSLLLHVAASVGGRLSTFGVKDGPGGGVVATALPAFTPGGTGASPSALLRSPLSGRIYVADVRRNAIYAYQLDATTSASETAWSVRLHNPIAGLPVASGSEFSRSMALSADGGRLYVAYRNPNALLIIDTAPDATGQPIDSHVDTIGLGGRPAQVVLAPTGPGGRELAYVSCFGTDDIWVVDPEARSVVAVVRLPHSPYGLAVANVPGRGWTLYTGLFSQHRIAVIDLDEGDPERHQVSAFIE